MSGVSRPLVALVVIAVAVYLGFTPLFDLVPNGVPKAVVSSSFGAIFVIILTMYLLNKQSEIQFRLKKGERVFDEKVKIFQQAIDEVRMVAEDGAISELEMNKLPFLLMKLQLVADHQTIQRFIELYKMLTTAFKDSSDDEVKLTDKDKSELLRLLAKFADECRKDLEITISSEANTSIDNALAAIEGSTEAIASKRDLTKYEFNGQKLSKGRYVLAVVTDYVLKNPSVCLDELKAKFPDNLQGSYGVVESLDKAKEIAAGGRKRHFINDDEVISLPDAEIAVCSQWGLTNITKFRKHMS